MTGVFRDAASTAMYAVTPVDAGAIATATPRVRAETTVGPSGTVAPAAASRARSPRAATTPVPIPAADHNSTGNS